MLPHQPELERTAKHHATLTVKELTAALPIPHEFLPTKISTVKSQQLKQGQNFTHRSILKQHPNFISQIQNSALALTAADLLHKTFWIKPEEMRLGGNFSFFFLKKTKQQMIDGCVWICLTKCQYLNHSTQTPFWVRRELVRINSIPKQMFSNIKNSWIELPPKAPNSLHLIMNRKLTPSSIQLGFYLRNS